MFTQQRMHCRAVRSSTTLAQTITENVHNSVRTFGCFVLVWIFRSVRGQLTEKNEVARKRWPTVQTEASSHPFLYNNNGLLLCHVVVVLCVHVHSEHMCTCTYVWYEWLQHTFAASSMHSSTFSGWRVNEDYLLVHNFVMECCVEGKGRVSLATTYQRYTLKTLCYPGARHKTRALNM